MSNDPPSIVRNGNHFIFLKNTGWVLIDGPWYDRLMFDPERGIMSIPELEVRRLEPVIYDGDEPPLTYTPSSIIEWVRVRWFPPQLTRFYHPSLMGFRYMEMYRKYRLKTGWYIYPDGELPILFNRLTWEPNLTHVLGYYQ